MKVSLEEMKEFLLIDGTHQDAVITGLIEASEAELYGSGVRDMAEGDKLYPLYKLAIKILVSRYFEDRGQMEKTNVNMDYLISKLSMYRGEESADKL
ncbi:head-tail connector protein [Salinicoccus carnicancri]|uniref:head-tail connector protein n=1 Tax=Salinicoccus carnicancri TaxID=558170 RepID=UPI0002D9C7A4|nr:head-tail connector protein [Salinicoccus carnicancri]